MSIRVLWGSFTPDTIRSLDDALRSLPHTTVQLWQGVREPDIDIYLFWIASPANTTIPIIEAARDRNGIGSRIVTPLRAWGDPESSLIRVANFVLRETNPDVQATLVPQIFQQVDAVVAQPGCLGSLLMSEQDRPSNLLGVTYWDQLSSFEAYSRWASEHPWRETINPVTQAVPLRLLTTRLDL